jgi:hypothetical protein
LVDANDWVLRYVEPHITQEKVLGFRIVLLTCCFWLIVGFLSCFFGSGRGNFCNFGNFCIEEEWKISVKWNKSCLQKNIYLLHCHCQVGRGRDWVC